MKIIEICPSEDEMKNVNDFLSTWQSSSDNILQSTSGSTGNPKEINIPKWKMIVSAKMTGTFLHLEDCTTALLCMDCKYIGAKMMIVRALQYNLTLYVSKVNSNPLKDIDFPIDFAAMVPLQVETILEENPDKLNLIKILIIGGAQVSDALINQLKNFRCSVFATFGMTETVSHIALRNLKDDNQLYTATGDVKFSMKEEKLVINSKQLKLKNLQTTDLVKLENKQQFYWLGRADFVINSGGVKIHPEAIERKLKSILPNGEFIISSLPDKSLGNKVIFIGDSTLEKEEKLSNKVNEILARYERPKAYYFLPEILKTEAGKLDRIKTLAVLKEGL